MTGFKAENGGFGRFIGVFFVGSLGVGKAHETLALYGLEDAGGNVVEFKFKTHDILVNLSLG